MGFDAFLGSGLYGSAAASQGTTSFADDVFRVTDDGEVTAKIAFQASAISSGTTRTILMPDADVDLGSIGGGGGVQNNFAASTDPSGTDDSSAGYAIGSRWVNNTTDLSYECVDSTVGTAVWNITNLPGLLVGLSTGVVNGGVLSVGTPNTTFTISDGNGYVIDCTNHITPTITKVTWTGKTNLTVTNLATNLITFVSIDNAGAVVQRTSRPTSAQQRNEIFLGVVVHVDKTIVDTVNNQQQPAGCTGGQLRSLADSIGFFNINGNVFSPNGANLNIDKTEGVIFAAGSNYENDVEDPHALTLSALTALSFQYRFLDGTNGVTGTAIDPNIYDLAGTSTAVPTNKFTIQRIYSFTSNNVKIQPGQVIYNNITDAKAGISTEAFTTEPSIAANGLLRGFLVVQEGATDLSNTTTTEFLEAGKFGESNGGGGGGGAGVTDHGALTGLGDDDHSQYLLTDGTRPLTGNQDFGGLVADNYGALSSTLSAVSTAERTAGTATDMRVFSPADVSSMIAQHAAVPEIYTGGASLGNSFYINTGASRPMKIGTSTNQWIQCAKLNLTEYDEYKVTGRFNGGDSSGLKISVVATSGTTPFQDSTLSISASGAGGLYEYMNEGQEASGTAICDLADIATNGYAESAWTPLDPSIKRECGFGFICVDVSGSSGTRSLQDVYAYFRRNR